MICQFHAVFDSGPEITSKFSFHFKTGFLIIVFSTSKTVSSQDEKQRVKILDPDFEWTRKV